MLRFSLVCVCVCVCVGGGGGGGVGWNSGIFMLHLHLYTIMNSECFHVSVLPLWVDLSLYLLCCKGGEFQGLSSSGLSPWRQHDPRQ